MNELTNIFKALSDETRLRIIKLLEQGERCVCEIVAALDMVQPKVSFHLSVLKEAGFIQDRKQGRWIHYRLDEADLFRRMLLLSVCERMADPERTRGTKAAAPGSTKTTIARMPVKEKVPGTGDKKCAR